MQVHTKFNGELSFQVWGAESLDEQGNPLPNAKPKQETPFQKQIITDAFFETWLNGSSQHRSDLFGYAGVGNGIVAATAADTTISQIGTRLPLFGSTSTTTVVGNTLAQTVEYRSTQGQIIGIISEVGLFGSTTGGQTMMRSLIKDSNGDATTLTLTAMDFIYIKWRVTTTVNLSDVTGVISIGGVSYNYALRPCSWTDNISSIGSNPFIAVSSGSSVGSYLGYNAIRAYSTQTLGSVTSQPGGGGYGGSLFSANTYTAGSKSRKMTYKFTINEGNAPGGIGSIVVRNSSGGGYQVSFSAVSGGGTIPKDNTKELTIGITFSYGR